MEIIAGLTATIAIVALGYATRQGQSLSFYGSVLIVIALVYVLFAAMTGAPRTIVVESAIATGFVGIAVAATRWENVRIAGVLMAVGLAAHGVYDLVHSAVVSNPMVPGWWPLFCGVVDILLGGWIMVLLGRGSLVAPPAE
jgi:ABC-type uncharacterized transport system permease subunit